MKVHELLSDPTKWTQNYTARNSFGEETDPCAPDAVCWCIFGAVIKCYDDNPLAEHNIYEIIEKEIPGHTIPSWNDSKKRTYEEVYVLVKRLDI